MTVEELEIPGVLRITPRRFADDRGWFSETYNQMRLAEAGINLIFVQDNHSLSQRAGTLRGFHFQRQPRAQAKLVRCTRGRILDIAVDLRKGSPHFGRHVGVELSPRDGAQLLIPIGFAHAFLTLEPDTEIVYKVTDFYAPECDAGIRWDDPDLAFPWKIPEGPFLSAKDETLPLLREIGSPFE